MPHTQNHKKSLIRRAELADAGRLHETHMESIREVCAKDYTQAEIDAWAGRPYDEKKWHEAISKHSVWVVEVDGVVEGHAYFRKDVDYLFLHSLYFTRRAMGLGLGAKLMEKFFEEAKAAGLVNLKLESTLTSHAFYKKLGFKDDGPLMTVPVNGCAIRCIPMSMTRP